MIVDIGCEFFAVLAQGADGVFSLLAVVNANSASMIVLAFPTSPEITVTYPLLNLEGTLSVQLDSTISVHNTSSSHHSVWSVVSGKFKTFVSLNFGRNHVVLQHGYYTKTITVDRVSNICEDSYLIQPLYVIFKNSDGTFQSRSHTDNSVDSAIRRISLACALIQTFTAVNISQLLNIEPKYTFQFPYDAISQLPSCEIFYSKHSVEDVNELSEADLWKLLAKELVEAKLPHLVAMKFIMFLSNTRYNGQDWKQAWRHRDIVTATRGYAAIGTWRILS